ncbi:MAG: DUF4349 domain-containing protein [Novosphingobium sp.]|nr:DUF4349 domain-containing protein [Novosphingobium sp.]MCP5402776.1 DUF4349 domain-containing protein [Novosphingobium sp.]
MKRSAIAGLALLVTLAGCGQASDEATSSEAVVSMDMAAEEAPEAEGGAQPPGPQPTSIPVSLPKIAYVYDYGFRLAAERIPELQRKHADLCEKQGPQQCRLLDMRQSGSEGDYASGSLSLAVAAPRARGFGAELVKLAGETGGTEISSAISGEDLSKQIVDTEARLRARTLLRDRLMEVLASRKGSVSELVEAERAVAQVNEEIDQARSWLTEMQGRVDFSRVNVRYQSGSPSQGGFTAPIRSAVGNIGTILGTIFAMAIVALTIMIPVGLAGWGVIAVIRRVRGSRRSADESARAAESGS